MRTRLTKSVKVLPVAPAEATLKFACDQAEALQVATRERFGDEVIVEIHGVDVYDPSTGEVRSRDTDRIALWLIDSDYDGESFFVRHAYFTGGQDPYKKLKRDLKAEIDEDAWASLYRTTSRPFPKPTTGKIAVKVINDYGDEVVKVFEV